MSTWTFRSLFALSAALLLAGCEELEGQLPAALSSSFATSRGITQVPLAGGAVQLTAPPGYCVDRRSLRRNAQGAFALLARCDTMGGPSSSRRYELALLAVTTRPMTASTQPPTKEGLARAASPARVITSAGNRELPIVLLDGGAPIQPAVSSRHWRGAFLLNQQIVGVSLYAPEGSPALERKGAELIGELAVRTRRASAAQVVTSAARRENWMTDVGEGDTFSATAED